MRTFLRTCLILWLALLPATATAVDVTADDAHDAYNISGAVILDGSFESAREAAGCDDCHWQIVTICPPQLLDERMACSRIPCPTAQTVAEVWRADAATRPLPDDPSWTYRGLLCLDGAPVPTASVHSVISDTAVRALPPLKPSSQPAGISLTGLATYFSSGQPALVHADATVSGIAVHVTAYPQWTWDFGHGLVATTGDPGAAWPNSRIQHTYPRRGIYRVRVTTGWRAVYATRGITEIPVDGVISQSAWFDLRVREARRFLRTPQGA